MQFFNSQIHPESILFRLKRKRSDIEYCVLYVPSKTAKDFNIYLKAKM